MELLPNGFFPPLFLSDRRLLFSEWSLPPPSKPLRRALFLFSFLGVCASPGSRLSATPKDGSGANGSVAIGARCVLWNPVEEALGMVVQPGTPAGLRPITVAVVRDGIVLHFLRRLWA